MNVVKVAAQASDGSDVISVALPQFPHGMFVAMSADKTFHYYCQKDSIGKGDN